MSLINFGKDLYKASVPLVFRRYLYRSIRYHGLFEWGQNKARQSPILDLPEVGASLTLEPGDIVIDCGANVGDLSSRFARAGAKVYAFEPNPVAFDILSNRFKYLSQVECFNQGVMDKQCTLSLRFPGAGHGVDILTGSVAGSFVAQESFDVDDHQVDVDCISLAGFISSLGKRIKLLKVDIEGAEIVVLNGLIDAGVIIDIDEIVVETHEKQMPYLLEGTNALRKRIQELNLGDKINLDWP